MLYHCGNCDHPTDKNELPMDFITRPRLTSLQSTYRGNSDIFHWREMQVLLTIDFSAILICCQTLREERVQKLSPHINHNRLKEMTVYQRSNNQCH